jgi:hypothetical protein
MIFHEVKISIASVLCRWLLIGMNGTLAWDISEKRDPYTCIDICPDTVYQESRNINREYNKTA